MHLLLTLGHNSSAIAIGADSPVVGYEQERLNRVKSSSAFPNDAIDMAMKHVPDDGCPKEIFISHWFDNYGFYGDEIEQIKKYYDYERIKALKARGYTIKSLDKGITHHDAHAWSAVAFFESHYQPINHKAHIVVADGFGNRQEVLSVYEVDWDGQGDPSLKMQLRVHGYSVSLGLFYQYATAFCGMKENQDEYKFLGYESRIKDVDTIKILNEYAEVTACVFWNRVCLSHLNSHDHTNEFINLDDLKVAREFYYSIFDIAVKMTKVHDKPDYKKRIVIGYFIQQFIERFYERIICHFKIENLLLAGGLHYNVKLNNAAAKNIPGQICIVPLAGDQGCAIGLRRAHGHRFPFNSLLWGHRSLRPIDDLPDGVIYTDVKEEYVDIVAKNVSFGKLVNTVTGAMEFGPRALCNTSTLALPYNDNVKRINELNGRDTVMPFAGVMLERNLEKFHDVGDAAKVIGSLHYMITTLDYKQRPNRNGKSLYAGIMHKHPTENVWTGRPQVVTMNSDRPIRFILEKLEQQTGTLAVINTSLNVHGVPIVYSVDDALNDFKYNCAAAAQLGHDRPILVIGDF
jgi:predicted NodU family carbamoyl transferase